MSKEMSFPAESRATPGPVTDGLLGFVGAIAGLGAIGASSCCVLPLALASVGAGSGVFSFLEFLAPSRTPTITWAHPPDPNLPPECRPRNPVVVSQF